MTIIKDTRAIRSHPLAAIDPEVANLINHGASLHQRSFGTSHHSISVPLQLLEAYCDIAGLRITMETLRSSAIEAIMQGFCAAMAGNALLEQSGPRNVGICRRLYQSLTSARARVSGAHALAWDISLFKPDPAVCARIASTSDDKRWYWKGWAIQSPHKRGVYLRLGQLVVPYGRKFVEAIFAEVEKDFRGRPASFHNEWNDMFDYLGEHQTRWPRRTFNTEEGVKSFMQAFTIAHFTKAEKAQKDAKSQIKSWNTFVSTVEVCLCKTGVWANLSKPIKKPPSSTKRGSETKLKECEDGLLVQEKLLTSIPLHVTDSEAVEVLFFHIKNDLATVRGWAAHQAADLKSRQARRVLLAQKGNPIIECKGSSTAKKYTLADVCATLEATSSEVPPAFLCKVHYWVTGENCSGSELANYYGYPVTGSLFPLQCLLVLEHPEITTEFLRSFELYNEQGQLTGFDEEKRLLTGYKNRKRSDMREQVIKLNDISFQTVKDIIEITSVCRRKLRAQGDDSYRYLFITSGTAFDRVRRANVTYWNKHKFLGNPKLREQLIAQFSPHSDLPADELIEFIKRVRLTKIRTSRAVEIFIQTKSSEAMSKALGHERYYPDLLSHYLPDALLAFIKARWIRIFQKALVCEAMKDSPNLLRATQFNTMNELDDFLANHRIKEIPSQASDPERTEQWENTETSEAVLSIGVPFLASLLSLEVAVTASTDRARVCGKAEYWASFADKIKTEIKKGSNRLLKKHLNAALKLIDAKKMEKLIYVPAHWA
ncbi:hypothetical protein DM872_14000 [Pseudomonas taiwanensis]|uniref:hypothetical protein n=3 Tax=Pseudomonas TaxID=286 RepID=UPI0015B9557F|nr:hypothetical protein [Pseudomonas taiwanensis]MDH4652969.1 hypothetical protein [Pseudomonas sp. BN606]MDH4872560.1 hypothetical protein [Pseudomonas sp. BN515]NWL77966.1 hypothetical protein [Pseudomonas taiwanensis]